MSAITTYILDTATGRPGAGIPVTLEGKTHSAGWQSMATGVTDNDGRLNDLLSPGKQFEAGHYRLIFETGAYFLTQGIECFFPQITVSFVVRDVREHYHLPLVLGPFGYTAYRGQ